MNFSITEEDIINYLNIVRETKTIPVSEEMFVDYLRNFKYISKENLEILMRKYNKRLFEIDGTYTLFEDGVNVQVPLTDYESYLKSINNLDITGISLMAIPIISRYNLCGKNIQVSEFNDLVHGIGEDFTFVDTKNTNDINSSIRNYILTGKVDLIYYTKPREYCIKFNLSSDEAKQRIECYEQLYGKENADKVKNLLKERV